jgi:hypothetical protein
MWRPWLRAVHRDVGYLAVGLTVVYAASGIAVNHIKDWDPNFRQVDRTLPLPAGLPQEPEAMARALVPALGLQGAVQDVYALGEGRADVVLERAILHVDRRRGQVRIEGQEPRMLLRVANWLHLNRGKPAWTYIADAYAGGLLLLALSGMWMIAGRKGLWGRGGVLVVVGVAVPIVYVHFSGGP